MLSIVYNGSSAGKFSKDSKEETFNDYSERKYNLYRLEKQKT
jgi:hypothetical protein